MVLKQPLSLPLGAHSRRYISGGINYMLSFSRTPSGASPEWAFTNETNKWELVDKEF